MARPLFKESNFSCVKNGPRAAKYGGELKDFSLSTPPRPNEAATRGDRGCNALGLISGLPPGYQVPGGFFDTLNT